MFADRTHNNLPPGFGGDSRPGDRLHEDERNSSGRPASSQARSDAPRVSGVLGITGALCRYVVDLCGTCVVPVCSSQQKNGGAN